MADNDQWLWFDEDDTVETPLAVEPAASGAASEAFDSQHVVSAITLHVSGNSGQALELLKRGVEGGTLLEEIYPVMGQICFELKRYEEAAEAYGKLATLEPRHKTAAYNLGVCREKLGDYDGAVDAFQSALEGPRGREARRAMAICLLRRKEYDRALDHFDRHLTAGENEAALFGKALCLHRLDRSAEAIDAYRRLLARYPESSAAMTNLIALGMAQQNWSLVREFSEKLLKLNRGGRVPLQGLASAALAGAKWELAAGYLNELVKVAPDSFEAHYNLAVACEKLGRRAEAVRAAGEAVRLNPNSARAAVNLGVALQESGDHAGAAEAYEKALRMAPGLPSALYNLALLANQRGDRKEAAILYQDAVSKGPDCAEAWFGLGYLQLLEGEDKASIESFRTCLKLRAGWSDAQLNLAIGHWRAGDPEAARRALEAARTQQPDSPAVLRALAALALERDELEPAQEYQRRLHELGGGSAELSYNLGCSLHQQNRHSDAADAYREAVAANPGFAEAYLNLGHALHALGREEEAQANWDRALDLKPELALTRG